MAVTSGLYVLTFADVLDATDLALNLALDTHVINLYNSTKTTNQDTDTNYALNGSTNELATGGGYTRNTKTLSGTTPTIGLGATGILKYTWTTAVSWSAATFTANGFILNAVTSGANIIAVAFGSDFTCTAGTFTITANASGIFTIDLVP